MPTLSILIIGDANRAEFRAARANLSQRGTVRELGDAEAAAAAMAAGEPPPDVIVVAQARPGEFSRQAIDRLRRLAPLARIVGLMGSWCEGEMRSGAPWPASARAYWHQWPARGGREFQRLARGEPGSWSLPVTATEEERLLADADARGTEVVVGGKRATGHDSRRQPPPSPSGLVLIRSRSSEMAGWLLAACRDRGMAAIWHRRPAEPEKGDSPHLCEAPFGPFRQMGTVPFFRPDARVEGATAAIFDAAELDDAECDELRRFAAAAQPAPVIALLAFPRIDDQRRALSAGATALLSKPVALMDLFWQIG